MRGQAGVSRCRRSAWARRAAWLAVLALICAGWPRAGYGQQETVDHVAEQFHLLPLRIHLLRAKQSPLLNSRLREPDVRRILSRVNGIWRPAGIQFYTESIRDEAAAAQELYESLGANRSLGHVLLARPRASRSDRMFHLYFVRELPVNGVCFEGSPQLLFVKDTARLNPVPGGIDEPLPRVSAHEIGHALGLAHRQDRTNLMASGTTGTSLNEQEIGVARGTAAAFPWRRTPAGALEEAEWLTQAGDLQRALDLCETLVALPDSDLAAPVRKLQSSIQTRQKGDAEQ